MSTINVVESHQKSVAEIKSGLSQFEEMFKKYGVKVAWSGANAALSGPVSGEININDSTLKVTIKLGMMAKMAGIDGARLESSIRKRLRVALD
mgnify:FL=1